eukprot:CAMPEP_0170472652 /NCGR_PEP_ID=MMETSP0123-20130129/14665_1 /TAXON_ID=182087 /ORGANISM="Favella ehrenbergii, Strain Fehren 1" /LENGTH=52 /DNA_ID=CAMNT_0010741101 /DNA_START=140 /DNA_END=298 /DNA_ORIENTATION=-
MKFVSLSGIWYLRSSGKWLDSSLAYESASFSPSTSSMQASRDSLRSSSVIMF